ncbi:hypothetical protein SESBI_18013 [Sesbania bispinosa]|nr:hypothetical protein SESBI_18013 [Sesbania bispinosa]
MASVLSNSAIVRGREEVYVAAMPLRATKGPPQLLMSAAYSLNFWDLQHFMVLIKPSSPSQVLVFDFQPKDPEDIYVALAVLSGRAVPGAVLVRKLKNLPRRKCWPVGYAKADAVEIASEFNKKWETNLRIGLNDCRDYTNGLVRQLTGEKDVLKRLRNLDHDAIELLSLVSCIHHFCAPALLNYGKIQSLECPNTSSQNAKINSAFACPKSSRKPSPNRPVNAAQIEKYFHMAAMHPPHLHHRRPITWQFLYNHQATLERNVEVLFKFALNKIARMDQMVNIIASKLNLDDITYDERPPPLPHHQCPIIACQLLYNRQATLTRNIEVMSKFVQNKMARIVKFIKVMASKLNLEFNLKEDDDINYDEMAIAEWRGGFMANRHTPCLLWRIFNGGTIATAMTMAAWQKLRKWRPNSLLFNRNGLGPRDPTWFKGDPVQI